ncbi:MAG: N-acetylglucosamine-6-phosphate deacetylase [Dehalococcoidia bacterium]|nr:N-acetylglucosamine-6-phosphate deacetylase [Dehalococcoidia bacterium]
MTKVLAGARVLTPDDEIAGGSVIVEDGRIVEVAAGLSPPAGAEVVDLRGLTLAPGFIDIHVHGGGGFSLATGDAGEVRSYARWVVAHGVTSFVASIVGETPEEGEAALRAVAEVSGPAGGAELLGAHLEGPFVSPERRGALPEGWLRPPDAGLLGRYLEAAGGRLRLLTLAPELPGAAALLEQAVRAGCVVAVGHSDATYQEARDAFARGARHLTHAFNAMRPFHHREPGPLGAALDTEGVTLELIADGVHVHSAAARMVVRAKGIDGVVLVTDGVPPAGLSEGSFRIGGRGARLAEGRIALPDGTIAGSAATMERVVRHVVAEGIATAAQAVRMASTVPAGVLGLEGRKGRIARGYDADLVALDSELNVAKTWVAGLVVHGG